MGVTCPVCGEANRDTARFCAECGVRLVRQCAVCGEELPERARFCDSCGTPVEEPPAGMVPADADLAPTLARKVVTVVFADLQGSTTWQEHLDPESVRAFMERYYAAMRAEVEGFGGRVVKFVGDGVMATFGIPHVREDDARRAVQAATAMVFAFDRLVGEVPDRHFSFGVRVGVNTGEVVVSEEDDDVVGDAVNVASRLETAASVGEVLVGEDTWRLTRDAAVYEPVEPMSVKGRAQPVAAYRLIGMRGEVESGPSPFVGRDAEMRVLREAFDTALATSTPQRVTVIGSPGVGKSRLARELHTALAEQATVLEARCDAAVSATFAPIAETMRAGLGVDDSAEPEDVVAVIADLLPDDSERDRAARRAAAILGAGDPGSPQETFWAVRRLVETLANRRPLALVFDDVHWAEPLLLDLIEHLAEWTRQAPVLLVVLARPELRDVRPSLATSGPRGRVLSLEGLDPDATAALACELLDTESVPRGLVDRLATASEGNPLFVRELLRMFVDDGVLAREGDHWLTTIAVDDIEVPPTIHSLLASRIDRLTPDERTVLERAAVIGREVYRGALAALLPGPTRARLDEILEGLRRNELLEPEGTYWIDEPVLRFHHVLIRDAAYRRLLKEVRADLHERVAAWLDAKAGADAADQHEVVGYHLEQAWTHRRELGHEDAGEIGRRAAQRLAAAARRALDRDDLPATAALSGRALRCLAPDDESRAELLLTRLEALIATGDVTRGAEVLDELGALAAGEPRLEAWAACYAVQLGVITRAGALRELEQQVVDAAALLSELGDPTGAAKAHTMHALVLARLGQVAQCEAALDRALTAARAAGDQRRITAVLGTAPVAALWGPSPVPRAGGRCLDVVRLLRITTGARAVEATSTRCQAVLEAFRGRGDAARRMLASARRHLEDLGLEHGLLEADLYGGIVELAVGEAVAAERLLQAAYDGFVGRGARVDAAQAAALLSRAFLEQGRDDDALAMTEESERLAGEDLKASIAWRSVRAQVLAHRGEHDEAVRLARAAVGLAENTDALVDHADSCRALSVVLAATGDADGAARAAGEAAALYERKGAIALAKQLGEPEPSGPPETGLPATGVREPRNLAFERWRHLFDVVLSRDWEAVESLLTDDMEVHDLRAGFGASYHGRAAHLESLKALMSVGVSAVTIVPVATRGERLILSRVRYEGVTGFEGTVLDLRGCTLDGLAEFGMVYDLDDLDAAYAELDRRYLEGEAAPFAHVWRTSLRAAATFTRTGPDLEAVVEDLVFVDHRPVTLGALNSSSELSGATQELVTLVPDLMARFTEVHTLNGHGSVTTGHLEGRSTDGADIVLPFTAVGLVEGGRQARWEIFDVDDIDRALSRFLELTGGDDEMTVVRMARRYIAAHEARDWEAIADCFAEGHVTDDRRRGVSHRAEGRAARVELAKVGVDIGATRFDVSAIATLGDRAALFRTRVFGDGEATFDTEHLSVLACDSAGQLVYEALYDLVDRDAAFLDLVDRFAGGEGEGHPVLPVMRVAATNLVAYNRRDWATVRACYADDVVTIDHRLAGTGETVGAEGVLERHRAMVEVVPDIRFEVVDRGWAMTPQGFVSRIASHGTGAEGSVYESRFITLTHARDGLITRVEYFADDDLEAAIARAAELDEPPEEAVDHETSCVRTVRRYDSAYEAGDWSAAAALIADDIVVEDRRPGLGHRVVGRDAALNIARTGASVGATRVEATVLSLLGDRLALVQSRIRGDDDETYEAEMIEVVEVDESGRIVGETTYDVADHEEAFREMIRRFADADPVRGAPLQIGCETVIAYNHRDWEAMRRGYAADAVTIDHRPANTGEMRGPDAILERHKALIGVVPDLWVTPVGAIRAISRHGFVTLMHGTGTGPEGSIYDSYYVILTRARDGLISHVEFFPEAGMDTAIARARELDALETDSEAPNLRLENECTRIEKQQFLPALCRGDIAWFEEHLAPHATYIDRRRGFSAELTGREEVVAALRATSDVGVREVESTVLAVRGERLALTRDVYLGVDYEVEAVAVVGIDASGRAEFIVQFDVDDLSAAWDELDERYLADESRNDAIGRVGLELIRSYNRRDWDAMAALYAPDIVATDHRSVGMGVMRGVDALMARHKAMVEVVPGFEMQSLKSVLRDGPVTLNYVRNTGHGPEESIYEHSYLVLVVIENGLLALIDTYAPEQLDDAVAKFHERLAESAASDGGTLALQNRCTRVMSHVWQLLVAGAVEDLDAWLAPTAVLIDRRAGLRHETTDRGEQLAIFRMAADLGVTEIDEEVLAVRGDHLALHRIHCIGRSYDVEMLSVSEIDDDGRGRAMVQFDVDDVDAAYRELDERFIDREPADLVGVMRLGIGYIWAYNERDWDTVGASYADDVMSTDHRRIGFGEMHGRDVILARHQAMVEVAPDYRLIFAKDVAKSPRAWVALMSPTGSGPEGSAYERSYLAVVGVAAGRIYRSDVFDNADLDAALALFRELDSVADVPTDDPLRLDNRCVGVGRRFCAAICRNDVAELERILAPDAVLADRRSGLRSTITDHAEQLEVIRVMSELGLREVQINPLAIRGDRLALTKDLYLGDRYEVESLSVTEIDADGCVVTNVQFDVDDVDAAHRELDDRWLARDLPEGPRVGFAYVAAYNARDWDAVAAIYDEDVVSVDHRPVGLGEMRGRATLLARHRAMVEVVSDYRLRVVKEIASSDRATLALLETVGSGVEGSTYEQRYLVLSGVRDGRIARAHTFDVDAIDDAIACFQDLDAQVDAEPETRRPSENLCIRALETFMRLLVEQDLDALRAAMTDDNVYIDRRAGLGLTLEGADANLDMVRAFSRGLREIQLLPLEVRGERFAMCRILLRGDFEVEVIHVNEVDSTGLVCLTVAYEVTDLDAARRELDERYNASPEAALVLENECTVAMLRLRDHMLAGQIERGFALMSPDYLFEDRRAGLRTTVRGLDDNREQLIAVGSGLSRMDVEVIATRAARLALFRVLFVKSGLEFEMLHLDELDETGLIMSSVTFDLHDIDAAHTELNERYLAGEGAPYADSMRPAVGMSYAYNDRDWARLREVMAVDVVAIDHRPGSSWRFEGAEVMVARQQAMGELVPDYRTFALKVVRHDTRGLLAYTQGATAGPSGAGYENPALILFTVRGGKIVRMETFSVEQLDDALASWESLS